MTVLPAVDADRARDEARRLLSGEPYRSRRAPRPFQGVLERLGDWIVEPVQRFFERLGDGLPGAGSGVWVLVAIPVVAIAAVVALRLIRDRDRIRLRGAGEFDFEGGDDPEALERRADEAERRGDLDGALRLRFRAGLLRLDRLGAIELRPGLTNSAAARRLRSRRFDGLARNFDEVAYGGRPATPADLAESRSEWPDLLVEAGGPR